MALNVRITGHENKLKLMWSDPASSWWPAPYLVSLNQTVSASNGVRNILTSMTNLYSTTTPLDYSPLLMPLMQAGEVLFSVITSAVDGNSNSAREARDALRAVDARTELHVVSDGTAHIPWPFVFLALPDNREFTGTLEDFNGFLGDKFYVNTRFNVTSRFSKPERGRAGFQLLSLVNWNLYSAAKSCHSDNDRRWAALRRWEREIFEFGAARSWKVGLEAWKRISDRDSILYVFGHSNGTEIHLDEPITPAQFRVRFEKADPDSATICFLNGCRTGAGHYDDAFLTVTSEGGFHGFIGTEAEVPNAFAMRYGLEFLYRLYWCNQSVQEAMDCMRKRQKLFPLSLLYSSYANPHFRISN